MTGLQRQTRRPRLPGLRTGLIAVALSAYLATTGCGTISVNDNSTAPTPPSQSQAPVAPATSPRHDLAILGTDFDPALDLSRLANHEPVSLIVGISNQGNQRETGVLVTADLWSADGTDHLLHTQQTIDSIAPGNVLPLRLTNPSTPDALARYRLIVKVSSVAGETNTQNNSRNLDILVNAAH